MLPERDPSRDEIHIELASFGDLKTWEDKDHLGALKALLKSCEAIVKRNPEKAFSSLTQAGTNKTWQDICQKAQAFEEPTISQVKLFFERNFQPYLVKAGNKHKETGLFTGYYEASLRGSRSKHGPYQYPLYKKPDDLVMVQLGEFRDSLKGQRIAGRVEGSYLKPYESRKEIDDGNWAHNREENVLAWTDDLIDVFFLHIQGSGVVELDDGSIMRVGYAGQNGHSYYAIGRELVKREYLAVEDVSMQSIREWLEENTQEGKEIMNLNASYVFFRDLGESHSLGGSGVALTPGVSLAIDHSFIPYGAPLWVDIKEAFPDGQDFRRLMIAQDTGGAIRGPVRGDVYWGFGPRAEKIAGQMKARGKYWIFLPR